MPSRLSLWSQYAVATRHLINIGRPREAIFLISHIRSYSSLLCHILNSNPEIDGYGELAIDYRTPADLFTMRNQIAATIGKPLSGRYTLDKLLHRKYQLADPILLAGSTRIMIGIREPEASVRSIIAMGLRRTSGMDWKSRPRAAARHYLNRMTGFARLVERRPDVVAFPTDAVINDTTTFLSELGGWLELKAPLRTAYELGTMTGEGGFGDNSGQILAGTINPDRPVNDIELPAEIADRIWDAYERTLDVVFSRAGRVLCADSRVKRGG